MDLMVRERTHAVGRAPGASGSFAGGCTIGIGSEVELAIPGGGRHIVRLVNPDANVLRAGEVSVFSALGRALTGTAGSGTVLVEVPSWPARPLHIQAVRRGAAPEMRGAAR